MPRSFSLVPALAGLLALGVSCGPRAYRPPELTEPHAILKVRYTHHSSAGTGGGSIATVDGHRSGPVVSPPLRQPHLEGYRIHPRPATFTGATEFFHLESQLQQVPYTEQETYSCPQTTGYGTSSRTTYGTCTRSVTRYRSEYRNVPVVDASCERAMRFGPVAGHVYLLEYEYQAHGSCTLSCYEQVPQAGGTFSMQRCPAAPPAR